MGCALAAKPLGSKQNIPSFMKNLFYLLVIIFSLFSGCTSRKERVEELIAKQRLIEAQKLIEKFSKEGNLDKDLLNLSTQIDYLITKNKCEEYLKLNQYSEAIKLIDENIYKFKNNAQIYDKVKAFLLDVSLQGTKYYQVYNDYVSAYNCLLPLLKLNISLDGNTIKLANNITKSMLTGIWEAKSIKWKTPAEMHIIALTPKTFYGTIYYSKKDRHYYNSSLSNGSFDNSEIAATYTVIYYNSFAHTYYTQTLNGNYLNGIFKVILTLKVADYYKYSIDTCYFKKVSN